MDCCHKNHQAEPVNHSDHSVSSEARQPIFGKTILVILLGLVVIAIVGLAVSFFNLSLTRIGFLSLVLACPLMHLWMMKSGGHKH